MVKVTIETTGKEKQILTGDMVNAMVLDDKECNFAFVKSSKNAINGLVFVSSLENIETYEKFDQGEVTVMMTKKNEDASLTG